MRKRYLQGSDRFGRRAWVQRLRLAPLTNGHEMRTHPVSLTRNAGELIEKSFKCRKPRSASSSRLREKRAWRDGMPEENLLARNEGRAQQGPRVRIPAARDVTAAEISRSDYRSGRLNPAMGQSSGVTRQTSVPQFASPPLAGAPKLAVGIISAAAQT